MEAAVSAVKVIDDPVRPFFTVRTLATYLQVSERMVRYWLQAGDLPSYQFGGLRRIAPSDADEFATKRRIALAAGEPFLAQPRRRPGPYSQWAVAEADYAQILLNDPCSYCGAAARTVDHIEPLAHDGEYSWTNTAACASCNSGKRDRPLLRFLCGRAR